MGPRIAVVIALTTLFIRLQQRYAKTTLLHEPVHLVDLVEDALRINAAALGLCRR